MAKAPAFQYYPKDLLSDAKVLAMSLTEFGAYWKLVSICWLEGTLPADVQSLARLLSVTKTTMIRLWPAIEPCFSVREDGRLVHPRLERERLNQQAYRQRQAANGAKGGRASKAVGSFGETHSQPNAKPNQALRSASPSPSPSPSAPAVLGLTRLAETDESVFIASSRQHRNTAHFSPLGDVPQFLHSEFVRKVMNGDVKDTDADTQVRMFYAETERTWAGRVVGDEPLKFWRAQFAEKAKTTKPMSNGSSLVMRVMGGRDE